MATVEEVEELELSEGHEGAHVLPACVNGILLESTDEIENGIATDEPNHDDDAPNPPSYESLDIDEEATPPPPYHPSFARAASRLFDISDPPPDYFSVVRNLQEARRESTSTCGFIIKALKIIFTLIGVLLLLFILMSFPIVMLGMGIAYLGQCMIEPLIPIFLIVSGVCGILKSTETLVKQLIICCKYSWSQNSKLKYVKITWRVAELLFNLVLFGWFIAGSYWVFHVYAHLLEMDFDPDLCNPILYKCAFGIMICSYILLFMTCCCVCGCACFRKRPSPEEEDRREEEEPEEFPECNDVERNAASSPPNGESVPLASSMQALDNISTEATSQL